MNRSALLLLTSVASHFVHHPAILIITFHAISILSIIHHKTTIGCFALAQHDKAKNLTVFEFYNYWSAKKSINPLACHAEERSTRF